MAKVGDVVDMGGPQIGMIVDMGPPTKPKRAPPGMAATVGDSGQQGVFGMLKDEASSLWGSARDALAHRPENTEIAKREQAARKGSTIGSRFSDIARGVGSDVRAAWDQAKKPLIDPETAKQRTAPARVLSELGTAASNVAGLAFSPLTGLAKGSGLATDISARTGLSKDASANLATMAVPGLGGARTLGAGEKAAGLAERAGAYGRKVFAPGTVDETARTTASLHRMAIGTRRAEADADMHALNSRKLQKVVGNAPVEDQHLVARYIDTRSSGSIKLPEKYQAAADQIKDTYGRYRSRIENVFGDSDEGGPSFVKDYYSRLWKNPPAAVAEKLERSGYGGGKQGSGRSLKARSIPTYEEGLKAGLTPVFANPLDATRAYVDNMASFLATHDVRNSMLEKGISKWVPERAVPADWNKLDGMKTTRDRTYVADGKVVHTREVLAAPESAARVFNNHISRGLEGTLGGPIYQGARKTANTLTQAKLSLSAFHAMTIGQESIVSGVKDAIKAASRIPGTLAKGDFKGAGRAALTAGKELAKAPIAPVSKALRGDALRKAILDPAISKGMDPKIVDAYVKAGGRATMDRFYSSNAGSADFLQSLKRGTFRRDLMQSFKDVAGAEGLTGKVGKSIELGAKALETTMAPVFKEMIPRIKAGSFADEMGQWYKLNPEASVTEAQRAAEKIVDSIDNRFGEMITDNMFWHRQMTQVAQLMLLSPSWDFGTARLAAGAAAEAGESMKGLLSGKGVGDNVAYAGALVGTTAIMNGVYTRMATGEEPSGMDYFAARTGGLDPKGNPERAMMPGYMKDVLGFYNDPMTEAENKTNPFVSGLLEASQNKDYFGRPIVRPKGVAPTTPDAQGGMDRPVDAAKFLINQVAPISLESSGPNNPDSALGPVAHFLGMKQAPAYLEDPEGVARNVQKYEGRDWKAKLKGDARREAANDQPTGAAKVGAVVDMSPKVGSVVDMGAPVKAGATGAGAVRPEFKPVVDYVSGLSGVKQITAENDSFHPAGDVHGQGKAMDFTIKGGRAAAADFTAELRRNLKAQGFNARVMDEYNSPSAGATAGHIHVSIR